MSEFKKGQLVAVRDMAGQDWTLRMYDHASPEGQHFCRWLGGLMPVCWWNQVKPAEEVWPNIFLGWERRAREQSDHAVEMESELVQRLRRQIKWLCEVLKNDARTEENNPLCPLNVPWDCEHTPCDECWERASLKAVKEKEDAG